MSDTKQNKEMPNSSEHDASQVKKNGEFELGKGNSAGNASSTSAWNTPKSNISASPKQEGEQKLSGAAAQDSKRQEPTRDMSGSKDNSAEKRQSAI